MPNTARDWLIGGLWVSALVVIMRNPSGFASILQSAGTGMAAAFKGVQG